jgi:hypothetical protein
LEGSLFALRLKRLPLLAVLLSELTLSDNGTMLTYLLKAILWHTTVLLFQLTLLGIAVELHG